MHHIIISHVLEVRVIHRCLNRWNSNKPSPVSLVLGYSLFAMIVAPNWLGMKCLIIGFTRFTTSLKDIKDLKVRSQHTIVAENETPGNILVEEHPKTSHRNCCWPIRKAKFLVLASLLPVVFSVGMFIGWARVTVNDKSTKFEQLVV